LRTDEQWEHGFPAIESFEIAEVLDTIYQQLAPRVELINSYCQDNELEIGFWVIVESSDEEMPQMLITSEFSRFLSELNADIEIFTHANMLDGSDA
jgi:hypothetical protein